MQDLLTKAMNNMVKSKKLAEIKVIKNKQTPNIMIKLFAALIIIAISLVGYNLWTDKSEEDSDPLTSAHQFSTTDARSLWVIVNKNHPLSPKSYIPSDLVVPEVPLRSNITDDESKVLYAATDALKNMAMAAKQQGINLDVQSGYRSYEFQQKLHGNYSSLQGTDAKFYSALPGYSEHQTGLAVDVGGASNPDCNVKKCFETTPEAKWLSGNSYKYGFVVRYPKGKQQITGYEYEPWHVRYVGIYLANQLKIKNTATLEEYFQLR